MKRFIAIALSLCMVIAMLSVSAMATGGSTTGDSTTGSSTTGSSTTGGSTTGGSTTGGSTTGGSTTGGSTTGGSTTGGSTSGGTTTGGTTTNGSTPGGSIPVGGGGGGGAAAVPPVKEPESAVVSFADVAETAYYYDAVQWAVALGVTNGMTETSFAPNEGCSRAQMVTFLWRAAGCPEPTSTDKDFADVSEDAYYYKALLWAIEKGITNGVTDTTFAPDQICTRAQMAAFLYRHAGSPAGNNGHSFADVSPDAYFSAAVAWLLGEGITNGTSDSTYSPSNTCTRGQMVTFLYRYLAQ